MVKYTRKHNKVGKKKRNTMYKKKILRGGANEKYYILLFKANENNKPIEIKYFESDELTYLSSTTPVSGNNNNISGLTINNTTINITDITTITEDSLLSQYDKFKSKAVRITNSLPFRFDKQKLNNGNGTTASNPLIVNGNGTTASNP